MHPFRHLILFDGTCGGCNRFIQLLISQDKKKLFVFAPLKGTTAEKWLQKLPDDIKKIDSLVLIEEYQNQRYVISLRSQAVFKLAWHLGKGWKIIGVLKFLPSIFFDWIYVLVARFRYKLFLSSNCSLDQSNQKERFLP